MYIPGTFRVDDEATLSRFVEAHAFGLLVTQGDGAPFATHLPFLMHRQGDRCVQLVAHMARANPQWRCFSERQEVLVVFSGPHAYVSPKWYATSPAVPTWNYAAVHVYGRPNIVEDTKLASRALQEMVEFFESDLATPWPGGLPDDYRSSMMQGIVVFTIDELRWEGKFKLSQNRSLEDRNGTYRALQASTHPEDRALAAMMLERGLVSADA